MGKFLLIALATLAALGILVHLVGAGHMGTTALTVPGTEHTPGFGLTWTVVAAGVCGLLFWRIAKGK
jgi:hypothetical protein